MPEGTTYGVAYGHRYVTTKTIFNAGRSAKIVAERLGGGDYISLNFYSLHRGAHLRPCEMPADTVIDFLREFVPDPA
nr:hypothetical protein [Sulfitobacter aestuariivivens]